ncbi:MAG TPA: NMD3-related protein [Alphaproteobacteria bacterium]|nr:NMD3-related protein [Alphaproteobacteria bacterium]
MVSAHKNNSKNHSDKTKHKTKKHAKHAVSKKKPVKSSSKTVHHASKTHASKHPIKKAEIKKQKTIVKHYSKKFCPQCGNIITDNHTLCKDCRVTDFDFKDIKIFICSNCKSYNHKNKWHKFTSLHSVIDKILEDNVKHKKVKFEKINEFKEDELLAFKAGVHKDINLTVSIGHEKFDLPAKFDVTLCPKCSKQGTKYFEGILQTRNVNDEIIAFIKNDAAKQRSKGVHINKEVRIEGDNLNIDYYYTDKSYLKVIAEKLRNHFGATLKHNAQLFSIDWETSKNLYRLNLLVEFPKYTKNDVLKMDNQLYLVVSMDEKIHVLNMKTNSKTLLSHKDTYEVLRPVDAIVTKKYPEFEVLDPNTYYQARLMNPSDKLEINQKIKVIIDGGEAWAVNVK